MMNEFRTNLASSKRCSALPFWREVYSSAFPDMVEMRLVEDLTKQRLGVDREIVLRNGKVLDVDEKVRWKDYGDIALEVNHEHVAVDTPCSSSLVRASDSPRDAAGWAFLSLRTDFLAYAILPRYEAWLFPFQSLQRALEQNIDDWMTRALAKRDGFQWKGAPNPTWITWNLIVPRLLLLDAVRDAMLVRWTPNHPPPAASVVNA